MKKLLTPIICLICILVVLLNIDSITDKIIFFLNQTNTTKIEIKNNYYKSNNYIFVSNTDNFTPYGIEDILNIMYSIINSGTTNFTFYCPKEYESCVNDMKKITKDKTLLTHLNNFVHPFNSFSSIEASISDSGEIIIKINYLYTEEEINQIEAKVKELINTLITPDITEDYDKIKTIHDYIINNTKYDLENRDEMNSHKAYGPLFNNVATCNGYTDLMAIFLTEMGYDNYKVATTEEVDENLYERVRKGDIKAFELFFNKYQPRLFAFCLNFVEDEDAAKDLVQESFILFWENHSQINANYAVVSYLFKIAHSCCCRYIRENSLNSHLSDLPGHELKEIELAYYKDDTVLSSIYVKDIETYYNKVIEKLPKQSQIVFKLRQRDGLNAEEIATKLSLSLRTVENHLYRATKFIRNEMKHYVMCVFYIICYFLD